MKSKTEKVTRVDKGRIWSEPMTQALREICPQISQVIRYSNNNRGRNGSIVTSNTVMAAFFKSPSEMSDVQIF